MSRLEDLIPGASVDGIVPQEPVTVVNSTGLGTAAVEVTYKDAAGRVNNTLLYRDDESRLSITEKTPPWAFDADGALFRLVSEGNGLQLFATGCAKPRDRRKARDGSIDRHSGLDTTLPVAQRTPLVLAGRNNAILDDRLAGADTLQGPHEDRHPK